MELRAAGLGVLSAPLLLAVRVDGLVFGVSCVKVVALLTVCLFSFGRLLCDLSTAPATVVPFVARLSSDTASNRIIPRSAGTLNVVARKDWMCAALSLLISGRSSEGNATMVRT